MRRTLSRRKTTAMNLKLGYALLRDSRVPVRVKLFALGIGAAATTAVEVLEIPLDGFFAMVLPLLGIVGDLVVGGAEAVIGPVIVACLLLPHMTHPALVAQIRAEQQTAPSAGK
jgi:hypothetical protein